MDTEKLHEDAPANSAGVMPDTGGVAKKDVPLAKQPLRRKTFKQFVKDMKDVSN